MASSAPSAASLWAIPQAIDHLLATSHHEAALAFHEHACLLQRTATSFQGSRGGDRLSPSAQSFERIYYHETRSPASWSFAPCRSSRRLRAPGRPGRRPLPQGPGRRRRPAPAPAPPTPWPGAAKSQALTAPGAAARGGRGRRPGPSPSSPAWPTPLLARGLARGGVAIQQQRNLGSLRRIADAMDDLKAAVGGRPRAGDRLDVPGPGLRADARDPGAAPPAGRWSAPRA